MKASDIQHELDRDGVVTIDVTADDIALYGVARNGPLAQARATIRRAAKNLGRPYWTQLVYTDEYGDGPYVLGVIGHR